MQSSLCRAIVSVSDKTGVDDFCRFLLGQGIEIVSTGGTAKFLTSQGIRTRDVKDLTGFPEMMEGRVKTLHPKVHGGILCLRDNEEHMQEAKINGIELIDLVIVNLYPFQKVTANPSVSLDDAIENIDIGGPTLLRAAAKNYKNVIVIVDPLDYRTVQEELDSSGRISMASRVALATKVFQHTNGYDFAIESFLRKQFEHETIEQIRLRQVKPLGKYAENWHQQGKRALIEGGTPVNILEAEQLHGMEMGYNNYLDADAALSIVKECPQNHPAVSIIKHGNPCGFATGESLLEAFERAWQGDSVSAFGSVIAANRWVDLPFCKAICERPSPQGTKGWFVEVLIAPGFEPDALAYLQSKKSKANLRILKTQEFSSNTTAAMTFRSVDGGVLMQESDTALILPDHFSELTTPLHECWDGNSKTMRAVGVATQKSVDKEEAHRFLFAVLTAKHIKSNAISIVREYRSGFFQLLGMGAGQPNRKDSGGKLAIVKAKENLANEHRILCEQAEAFEQAVLEHTLSLYSADRIKMATAMSTDSYVKDQLERLCVAGSDAFFPFEDALQDIVAWGIRSVIQPGGSIRDEHIIKVADELGVAMIFTGMRHFRH